MARFTIPKIQNVLKATTARLFGRLSSGTGRAEELTASQVRTFLDVYTTAQVDGLISAIDGLRSADIDTLAELNAILSDADVASRSYVDSTFVPQSTLSESIDDRVNALLVAGTNITITYNDAANTLTIASTASATTPSGLSGQVQFNNAGAFGGAAAVVYATTGTHLVVTAQGATVVPICAKGAASQSSNLFEAQTSAGSIVASISASGGLVGASLGFVGNTTTISGASSNRVFVNDAGSPVIIIAPSASWSQQLRGDKMIGWSDNGFSINPDFALRRVSARVGEFNNGIAGTLADVTMRNIGLNGAISAGGGVGIAFIANATTVPATNPTGGGILYVEAGALKYRGSSGTVTTLGPA